MHLSTTGEINGRIPEEVKGDVSGSAAVALNIAQILRSTGRTIIGGESKTQILRIEEARRTATERMIKNARSLGANGVIRVRYHTANLSKNITEFTAYGTAVRDPRLEDKASPYPPKKRTATPFHKTCSFIALLLSFLLWLNIDVFLYGASVILSFILLSGVPSALRRKHTAPGYMFWTGTAGVVVSGIQLTLLTVIEEKDFFMSLLAQAIPGNIISVAAAFSLQMFLSFLIIILSLGMKKEDIRWKKEVKKERKEAILEKNMSYEGCPLCGYRGMELNKKGQITCGACEFLLI